MLDKAIETAAPVRTECSICKVPGQIRKLNEDGNTAKFVSIGPYHCSSENIREMEICKMIYFKEFRKRCETKGKTNLDGLVSLVEELEPHVHGSYSENIEYSKEEFVKMILVDAGFILKLFYKLRYQELAEDDALDGKWWLIFEILEDLHLLENQLPSIVFGELSKLAFHTSRVDYLLLFSRFLLRVRDSPEQMKVTENIRPILHFTDLLRESCLQRSDDFKLPGQLPMMISVCSATKLHELGVKFKPGKSKSLLDLQFSDGILRIPPLLVTTWSKKLFRNMIALEHCHYPREPYIADYVVLLSCLIKTDEDADFLFKKRIIENCLDSSNNVRTLFHSLKKSTVAVSFCSVYGQLFIELDAFCDRPKTRWKAALRRDYYWDLKRNYWKTPLQTLATLGGILLIILTVIQAVCSILQVK